MRSNLRGRKRLPEPVSWFGLLLASAAPPANDACAHLTELVLEEAVIESAHLSDGVCQVEGVARPVTGSNIRFILYLPAVDRWSGRYYQIGNGGFAGAIHLPTLAEGVGRGDAMAATDTGHSGTGFDASWAAGNIVALADYGWRSIKATREAAQVIIGRYYGRSAHHRYFMGCSNGGRMALMAAARWPEDWDGVIAGAPANPWTVQLRNFEKVQGQGRSPGGWLTTGQLSRVKQSALDACPAKAIQSGVVVRPDLCRPKLSTLTCKKQFRQHCLSPNQARSVLTIIEAGYEPAAMDVADWERWIVNSDASAPSQQTFADQARQYLFSQYDVQTLTKNLDVRPDDLAAFEKRGGKVLSYFGWSDALIAPGLGVNWYRSVARATAKAGPVTDFYRLFMVPGMQHCQGGSGAINFGQSLSAPASAQTPEHDVRLALERWVEQGKAPEMLRDGDSSAPITLFRTKAF